MSLSSRQIAEAHYKLSIVLDLTSGRLSDAIEHAEKALESVLERIQELKDGLKGELPPVPVVDRADRKGKGKEVPSVSLAGDSVRNMSRSQMESELQEMEGLKEDLALKVCRTVGASSVLWLTSSPPGRRTQNNAEGANRIGSFSSCKST